MKRAAQRRMPNLIDPRKIPALIRHVVLATLPTALALAGCGDDGSSGGVPDTNNCGMCGCGYNGTHTETHPYHPTCGDTGAMVDSSDADVDTDADADADASDASVATTDACADAEGEPLNCSMVCASATTGSGFPSTCRLVTSETGEKMVECTYVQPCGRRPPELQLEGETTAKDPIGRHLAEAAFLEAASIDAFELLADELESHGAPRSLVRSARRAARDEVRHATTMTVLARRHGANPPSPRVQRPATRPLAAIALENAVEGCVRETYGALVAAWQGERAEDRSVRLAMRRIARDEARHAELAWRIAAWVERRLDPASRAQVVAARETASEALRRELGLEPDDSVVRVLGVPSRTHALALVDGMFASPDAVAA